MKAIVGIFSFFAIFATTGDAPEPVPPPKPATIIKKSLFSKILVIFYLSSSADFSPNDKCPPQPKPCVVFVPIFI